MSVSGEQAAGRDDVDPDIEQRLEVRTEVDLVEERSAGLELDKQIDVTGLRSLPTGDGTEDLSRVTTMPSILVERPGPSSTTMQRRFGSRCRARSGIVCSWRT